MPMVATSIPAHLADETAWLEATAELLRTHRIAEIDTEALAEFLDDMARRDRREVLSRLAVLIAHILKWQAQPERRSGSWKATIETQRQELSELLDSGVLRNHAEEIIDRAAEYGLKQAAAETMLPIEAFVAVRAMSLDEVLSEPMPS